MHIATPERHFEVRDKITSTLKDIHAAVTTRLYEALKAILAPESDRVSFPDGTFFFALSCGDVLEHSVDNIASEV